MSRHQGRTSDGDIVNYAGFGGLNQWQAKALQYYVRNRHVHDLGAGNLYYANKLMELGAARVTAVDTLYEDPVRNVFNDKRSWSKCAPEGVELDDRPYALFHEKGPQTLDVAFVAWPTNTYSGTLGLELICLKAKTVIYLGCNFDGTMCGSQLFWQYLRRRPVLAHAPARRNTLLVYGELRPPHMWPRLTDDEDTPPEERAAHYSHMGGHLTPTPAYFP
jgi:hypothetical protein